MATRMVALRRRPSIWFSRNARTSLAARCRLSNMLTAMKSKVRSGHWRLVLRVLAWLLVVIGFLGAPDRRIRIHFLRPADSGMICGSLSQRNTLIPTRPGSRVFGDCASQGGCMVIPGTLASWPARHSPARYRTREAGRRHRVMFGRAQGSWICIHYQSERRRDGRGVARLVGAEDEQQTPGRLGQRWIPTGGTHAAQTTPVRTSRLLLMIIGIDLTHRPYILFRRQSVHSPASARLASIECEPISPRPPHRSAHNLRRHDFQRTHPSRARQIRSMEGHALGLRCRKGPRSMRTIGMNLTICANHPGPLGSVGGRGNNRRNAGDRLARYDPLAARPQSCSSRLSDSRSTRRLGQVGGVHVAIEGRATSPRAPR